MRHAKKNNHLGRTSSHREAMLSNMAASLLLHKRISTTLAKAKELRKYIEPLITRGKEDTTHSRRVVFSYLQNKFAVSELFREISQKVGDRPGGYTRILKTGFRKGDNAETCIIELVDYNETYTTGDDKKKATKTRRSRSKAKSEEKSHPVENVIEEVLVEEAPAAEEASIVEETPVVEETIVEEAPVVEETQEVEEDNTIAEETSSVENSVDETPVSE